MVVSAVAVVKTIAFPIAALALDRLADAARDTAAAADDFAFVLRDASRRAAYGPAPRRVPGLSADALLAAAYAGDRHLLP